MSFSKNKKRSGVILAGVTTASVAASAASQNVANANIVTDSIYNLFTSSNRYVRCSAYIGTFVVVVGVAYLFYRWMAGGGEEQKQGNSVKEILTSYKSEINGNKNEKGLTNDLENNRGETKYTLRTSSNNTNDNEVRNRLKGFTNGNAQENKYENVKNPFEIKGFTNDPENEQGFTNGNEHKDKNENMKNPFKIGHKANKEEVGQEEANYTLKTSSNNINNNEVKNSLYINKNVNEYENKNGIGGLGDIYIE